MKDIEWPMGLTIDFKEKLLFWIDSRKSMIFSSNFEGENRKVSFNKLLAKIIIKNLYYSEINNKIFHY